MIQSLRQGFACVVNFIGPIAWFRFRQSFKWKSFFFRCLNILCSPLNETCLFYLFGDFGTVFPFPRWTHISTPFKLFLIMAQSSRLSFRSTNSQECIVVKGIWPLSLTDSFSVRMKRFHYVEAQCSLVIKSCYLKMSKRKLVNGGVFISFAFLWNHNGKHLSFRRDILGTCHMRLRLSVASQADKTFYPPWLSFIWLNSWPDIVLPIAGTGGLPQELAPGRQVELKDQANHRPEMQ